jgi:hypothetical protein
MLRIRLSIVLFTLGIGACNMPLQVIGSKEIHDTPTPTNTTASPSPTREIATPVPTDTAVPSATPSPTATEDLTPASLHNAGADLVCRFGPGLRYGVGGSLREGVTVLITARNGAGDWFQFELPGYPGKYCWVFANDVEVVGNLTSLSIAEAPPSFVTGISILLDPPVYEPATCVFPMTFDVTITIQTIGPTLVKFKRTRSTGSNPPSETVEFTDAKPRVFKDSLKVDAVVEHWFKVSVSSPNAIEGQGYGKVVCP